MLDIIVGIRQEFRHVPEILYRLGRRRFLRKMAERTVIFHDATLRQNLESRARENLRAALQESFEA